MKEIFFRFVYINLTWIIWSLMFFYYVEDMHVIFANMILHLSYMEFYGFISTNLEELYDTSFYLVFTISIFMTIPYLFIHVHSCFRWALSQNISSHMHFFFIYVYVFSILWTLYFIIPEAWNFYYYDMTIIKMYMTISTYYNFMVQNLYFFILVFQLPILFGYLLFFNKMKVSFYYEHKYIIIFDVILCMKLFFFMDFFVFLYTFFLWILFFEIMIFKYFYNNYLTTYKKRYT